jgi:predicted  nucleic acid-binding Zn-ribbon protein
MAKTDNKSPTNAGEQTIEQLQQRYQELNKKKIQSETQRDSATKRLEELKAQALEKYGTDDVAKLQEKLAEINNENARKKSKYQDDLDKIEKGLADVEAKFSEPAPAPRDGGQLRR